MSLLNAANPSAGHCRCCRYYSPEGRRGGNCKRLGVGVRGAWEACSVMIPAFALTCNDLEQCSAFSLRTPIASAPKVVSPVRVLAQSS